MVDDNEIKQLEKEIEDGNKKIELLQQKKIQDAKLQAITGEEPKVNVNKVVKQDDALSKLDSGDVVSKKLAAQDIQAQLRKTRIFLLCHISFGLLIVGFARFSFIMGMVFYMIFFIIIMVQFVLDVKKESYLIQKYDLPIKRIIGK